MSQRSFPEPRGPSQRSFSCEWCVKAVKWIPVLFIFSIICWSYYAFSIQLCIFTVSSLSEKILLLLVYHIVLSLFVWSYYQTIFTEVAEAPAKFRLPIQELERLYRAPSEDEQRRILERFSQNLPITNRAINGAIRFCEKCQLVKPDRSHHCSVCGTCVLKMDHHCPWINSCVCFSNYKFFILFLGYALLYCIYVALASLPYFILFWRGQLEGMGRFHILFLFFVSVMFAISLVSLFGYHIYLVLMNRTTLEAFRPPIFRIGGPDKNGYSLGHYNNFQEVFGDDNRYWFIPVFTSLGDGVEYPVQSHHLLNLSYESMGATPNSNSTIVNMQNADPNPQVENSENCTKISVPSNNLRVTSNIAPSSNNNRTEDNLEPNLPPVFSHNLSNDVSLLSKMNQNKRSADRNEMQSNAHLLANSDNTINV